jgi:hypothetical protein
MKKLLNITGDILLFSLLLIILVLPLLVSFNLDPKLRKVDTPVVAGVADSLVEKSTYLNVDENFILSDNLSVLDTEESGDKYLLRFQVNGLGINRSKINIGKLVNEQNATINYTAELLAKKEDLQSTKVFVKSEEGNKYLFDQNGFHIVTSQLAPEEKKSFEVIFQPTSPLSYSFEASIEIRAGRK